MCRDLLSSVEHNWRNIVFVEKSSSGSQYGKKEWENIYTKTCVYLKCSAVSPTGMLELAKLKEQTKMDRQKIEHLEDRIKHLEEANRELKHKEFLLSPGHCIYWKVTYISNTITIIHAVLNVCGSHGGQRNCDRATINFSFLSGAFITAHRANV